MGLFDRLFRRNKTDDKFREPAFTKESNLPFFPVSQSSKPQYTSWDTENAVNSGYKVHPLVYACVSKTTKAAASVPWYVSKFNRGRWDVDPDHELNELIKSPNPHMNWNFVLSIAISHLLLGGNAVFEKVQVGGNENKQTKELWPLIPSRIAPIPDSREFLQGYEYKLGNKKIPIPPEEILHLMFVDPANPLWGIGCLQAAAKAVDTDIETMDFNKVSMENRGTPDAVVTFKEALTQDQYDEARAGIRESFLGAKNSHMPIVMGHDAKWQETSRTPAELDFINSRKWSAEEICSAFDVPPPMVGLYENATLANIDTARKIFWLDAVVPLLEGFKRSLNKSIATEYGEDISFEFDISKNMALIPLMKEKTEIAEKLFALGVPFNNINERLDLGFNNISGGETGYLPANVLPATASDNEE